MPELVQSANADHISARFHAIFGASPRIFVAPGRVNLIGDHTDYNEGFVFPMAIDKSMSVAISARKDRKLNLHSVNFMESVEFDLDMLPSKPQSRWTDYVVGVARQLEKIGSLSGCDLLLQGEVPIGSGLSSSAAIEVATAAALADVSGIEINGIELALLCQRSENEFVGARCGIMDQFVSVHGQPGAALLLDCRSLEHWPKTLPKNVSFVVCNSMVKHSIAGGEYNQRRAECEDGVRLLSSLLDRQLHSLREISAEEFQAYSAGLPAVVQRRCRHVVSENARVLAAAEALDRGDLNSFGELMNDSHRSLRYDYEVSIPELDWLAKAASETDGCFGARMTGGGFGGCIVAAVQSDAASKIQETVAAGFKQSFGHDIETHVCAASEGVHRIL